MENPSNLIQTLIIGAGGLCTTILAIYGVWSKILKPWFKESREKRHKLANAIDHISVISNKLAEISKELQPNGGSSIKDQVKQIAQDVKVMIVERDSAFYLSKEPLFKTDSEGYCIAANNAICTTFGISEDEFLGLGWINSIIETDKDRVIAEWENVIESGRELSTYFSIKNPVSEEIINLNLKVIMNRCCENELVSCMGTVEKVTKKNYKKLKAA